MVSPAASPDLVCPNRNAGKLQQFLWQNRELQPDKEIHFLERASYLVKKAMEKHFLRETCSFGEMGYLNLKTEVLDSRNINVEPPVVRCCLPAGKSLSLNLIKQFCFHAYLLELLPKELLKNNSFFLASSTVILYEINMI